LPLPGVFGFNPRPLKAPQFHIAVVCNVVHGAAPDGYFELNTPNEKTEPLTHSPMCSRPSNSNPNCWRWCVVPSFLETTIPMPLKAERWLARDRDAHESGQAALLT
jgi:hypothetical protein